MTKPLIYKDLKDNDLHNALSVIDDMLKIHKEKQRSLNSEEQRLAYGIASLDYALADDAFNKLCEQHPNDMKTILLANNLMEDFMKDARVDQRTRAVCSVWEAENIFQRHMQNYSRYALFNAVLRSDIKTVDMLLSTPYVTINQLDEHYNTPTFYAKKFHLLEMMHHLMRKGGEIKSSPPQERFWHF